ncbi:hypothetical protein T01_2554 [Trichinella spiralis]|uniref:Uncharacterized protein n=1 Tax=Trichinella spiralis TaxID=6334 RepID=A0A0V1BAM5_TRISP|nr:hypothetical protein T01_2554 [Trichinella spiralis]
MNVRYQQSTPWDFNPLSCAEEGEEEEEEEEEEEDDDDDDDNEALRVC